ncbi:MAG: DUF2752 domain-containing protein [Flavobacteriaceae bacterium]
MNNFKIKPKHIGLLSIGMIVVILYFFINPSFNFFPRCPLYSTTGIYCPGCGSQRALYDFLHLDFGGVVGHNVLFLFGIFVLIYHFTILGLNTFFSKKYFNLLYHKRTPIIILTLVVVYWIVRNIPVYPFNLLAPN